MKLLSGEPLGEIKKLSQSLYHIRACIEEESIGLSKSDAQKILPQLITFSGDKEPILDNDALTVLILNEIKSLKKKLDRLENIFME